MNAQDLESQGNHLADLGRHDLLRHIGTAIWWRWAGKIREGEHPSRSHLLAFLRAWAAPVGDWLPPGMASYLADRLDPAVSSRDRGGRPRLSSSRESQDYERELRIAGDVLRSWQAHKNAGTPYPQQTALKSVAEANSLPEATVRLAFSRRRKTAELASVAKNAQPLTSLSNADIKALASGPKDMSSLIMGALTPSEIKRIVDGESLERVLRHPDEESTPRPYPFP